MNSPVKNSTYANVECGESSKFLKACITECAALSYTELYFRRNSNEKRMMQFTYIGTGTGSNFKENVKQI